MKLFQKYSQNYFITLHDILTNTFYSLELVTYAQIGLTFFKTYNHYY